MIKLKKLTLTLVALLAVTTGAWAQTETLLTTITNTGENASFKSGNKTFDDIATVTFSGEVSNDADNWGWYFNQESGQTITVTAASDAYTITRVKFYTADGSAFDEEAPFEAIVMFEDGYIAKVNGTSIGHWGLNKIEVYGAAASSATDPNAVTAAEINSDLYSGWSSIDEKLLKASDLPGFQAVTENQAKSWTGVPSTGRVKLFYDFVADGNVKVVIFNNGVYDSSYEEEELTCYLIYEDIKYDGDTKYFYTTGPAPAASSGPEVAWDKAKNSGSFTMPGGNVTLEPEYYPQAALTTAPSAINDVPATTDGAIVSAGTVKNIGETTTAQGTVMYYVSQTALDDAALLALAADKWTADVPTAADLAQGQAYVYYYVRGNDSNNDEENFSDGDILAANALTVTIAAEPTYAVTFADGVNPEPPAEPEWTASPAANVKKGQTVTVTYTGTKKVIGVKAEKKAAAPAWDGPIASEATAADYGKVVCAAGHLHDAKTAMPEGCTAVAIFAYIDGGNNRIAIALQDAEAATWNTITNSGAYKDALCAVPGTWNVAAPTDAEWFVGTKAIYEAIFTNLGSTVSDSYGTTYDDNVNAYITDAGGTAITGGYWSTSYDGGNYSWIFSSDYWDSYNMSNSLRVRPVLGF